VQRYRCGAITPADWRDIYRKAVGSVGLLDKFVGKVGGWVAHALTDEGLGAIGRIIERVPILRDLEAAQDLAWAIARAERVGAKYGLKGDAKAALAAAFACLRIGDLEDEFDEIVSAIKDAAEELKASG